MLAAHSDLYRPHDGYPRVEQGKVSTQSVVAAPFGCAIEIEPAEFTPLAPFRRRRIRRGGWSLCSPPRHATKLLRRLRSQTPQSESKGWSASHYAQNHQRPTAEFISLADNGLAQIDRCEFMAFQSNAAFAGFLRSTASTVVLAESAPAANFLLEERLPVSREQEFLTEKPGAAPTGWDVLSWRETFVNHYGDRVARPLRRALEISTFAAVNQDNHLAIESHQDVVRLESIVGLHKCCSVGFDTPSDLAAELRNLIRSRQPGQAGAFSDDQHSRLAEWLDGSEPNLRGGLNGKRDARPAFAAPFDEVEKLLAAPDWATKLRNALGLSHFAGSPAKPLPVVLCRYNLSRVERAARKAKVAAWAAVPTVLDAGNLNGPSAAFFPFPKAAAGINPFGFGVTVSLAADGGLDFKSELLHFRLDYTLDDFAMVGEITDEVTEAQLATYRQRHFDLLEQELQYRSYVP